RTWTASRLRMRPASFPDIRLAQLAALIQQYPDIHRHWITCRHWKEAATMLAVTASAFWDYHYQPAEASPWQPKKLGEDAIHYLLINAVVPMLFAYAQTMSMPALRQTAINWLQNMPAETNQVLQGWQRLGLTVSTAADGQALLELTKHYCLLKKCLDCRIGQYIIGH
ncbi:MAG TPA: DUF2851 family protein, partial [Flavihumibacter sp.]|nr:DUF2851 family protein [Flavihumibacter sp.]